jgi:long-subunit acyl-CoA synthetase (AMP-forming)
VRGSIKETAMATLTGRSDAETVGSDEVAPWAQTLCECFQGMAAAAAEDVAVRSADTGAELRWGEYGERVRQIAGGLAALGVRRGDTVALMMTNRVEFHPCDTAALHLGATPFSIYNTSAPEQIAYLFSNSRCRVVITERRFLAQVKDARTQSGGPDHIVCVDGPSQGTICLEELERGGRPEFDFEAVWRAVRPDDLATLIYTSGTTGPPKGVELTHANVLAQCRAVGEVLPLRRGGRITSYLPAAHAADRWSGHYNQMVYGLEITTVADARRIAAVLPEVRPTIWGGVPRIFEKLKAGIEAAIAAEKDAERQVAAREALAVALTKTRLEQAGEPVPAALAETHAALDDRVLARLRERIGLDQAEWIICGAAPLPGPVHEFLLALGLPVVELYGMSECSCVVTASHPSKGRIGTVGTALPGVSLKCADDGELLVKGPIVMRGYHHDPQRTGEALDRDGWLHTGDVAEIDAHGYVRIVDRKKELIINTAGKNMSPANIEERLRSASPLIAHAVCIGDGRPYNVALLVLDPEAASGAAEPGGVQGAVEEAVRRANAQLSRVEQIKRYALLEDDWLPGGELLTPTMKLRRGPIAATYAAEIESLYSA